MPLNPDILHPASNPIPHFAAASAIGLTRPRLQLNFPPTIAPQAGILKAGAAGIECSLKAKHALVPVMMGAADAQRFTRLVLLPSQRS